MRCLSVLLHPSSHLSSWLWSRYSWPLLQNLKLRLGEVTCPGVVKQRLLLPSQLRGQPFRKALLPFFSDRSSPLPRTPFLLKLWCFPSSFTGPFLFSLKILCPLKCSFINYYQYDYNSQVSISSPKLPPKYNIVVMNIFKLVRTSFKPSPYFHLHDLFSSIQWDAFLIYTMK